MVPIRFQREARFALAAAMDVAVELGQEQVGPEHLLFGIAKTSPDELPNEVDLAKLRTVLEGVAAPRTDRARPVRYTKDAKRILESAMGAATAKGRDTVMPGDLVDGLRVAMAASRPASKIFLDAGLEPDGDVGGSTLEDRVDALEYIEVSDASDLTFYDQIARCVRDAVASGVLIPGDRLPPIRRLAERLGLAPGTVARAYRALEAEGVVLTAGAAGTRVATPPKRDPTIGSTRFDELVGLMRPVAVAAFHLGASAEELFGALRVAAEGVFLDDSTPP